MAGGIPGLPNFSENKESSIDHLTHAQVLERLEAHQSVLENAFNTVIERGAGKNLMANSRTVLDDLKRKLAAQGGRPGFTPELSAQDLAKAKLYLRGLEKLTQLYRESKERSGMDGKGKVGNHVNFTAVGNNIVFTGAKWRQWFQKTLELRDPFLFLSILLLTLLFKGFNSRDHHAALRAAVEKLKKEDPNWSGVKIKTHNNGISVEMDNGQPATKEQMDVLLEAVRNESIQRNYVVSVDNIGSPLGTTISAEGSDSEPTKLSAVPSDIEISVDPPGKAPTPVRTASDKPDSTKTSSTSLSKG